MYPTNDNNPMIYYVNNFPHYCYPAQPDILYPLYPVFVPQEPVEQQLETGESLENYVKNMEQQRVAYPEEKVKASCLGFRRN